MRVYSVGLISVLATLACGCSPSNTTASKPDSVAGVEALHGDVIAALKRRHWAEPDAFEKCVLEPRTVVHRPPTSWNVLRNRLPGLHKSTLDSFWTENEHAHPVAPIDRGAMNLHVLTKTEDSQLKAVLHDVARSDYWDIFRTRYGNAVRVGLSAPGFSSDRRQALIYYEAGFDYLAAWGSYCLLKRGGEGWEIVAEYGVWES